MAQHPDELEDTETLLHGLIAECGDIIRTQLRPGMAAEDDPGLKCGYAKAVADLVQIAARTGEAVARLRTGVTRHHITVRHMRQLEGEG